jgi:hypothetical protein
MLFTLALWTRLGVLASCFILGSLCWSIFSSWGNSVNHRRLEIDQHVDFHIPQRHYSPAEVVTLQITSIREFAVSPDRLATCYSLASPENREVTGPLKRFADMIMTPPYDRLASCQSWQVGRAVIEDNYAAVMVSTISSDGSGVAFRFLLQLHTEPPYDGCWLTEAVQVLERDVSSDDAFSPKKESSLE